MQDIFVYLIVAMAIVVAGVLFYRRWNRKDACKSIEGCKDCPLIDNCNKEKE